jgi:S-(hydroxymethyl)glutathione dehydrogenase/alcohol dehydrogenase
VPLPIILGDEGAGVIEAVGPGSTASVGQHVIISWAPGCKTCSQCLRGRPARCQNQPPFGFADAMTTRFHEPEGAHVHHYGPATFSPLIVVPESAAIPVTRDIPLEVAALIGCCVATGFGAVTRTAELSAGQSAAIFGCGGVGLNVVQAASFAGAAPVIAVDVRPRKLDFARAWGATATVDASKDSAINDVISLSGGGVDYAFVAVGSTAAIETAISTLAPGGTCVLIGAPPHGETFSVNPAPLRANETRIVGSAYGSLNPPLDFPLLVNLYQTGKLRLDDMITTRYDLDQANEAFVALAAGDDARGLIVF